jgi:hypothetical protein
MSIRQDIVDQIDTNLKAISTANGYSFDINGNVFEWLATPMDENNLPAIIFRDTVDSIDPEDEQEHNLEFEVVLVDKGNASTASVRNKMQDILTAFHLIRNEDDVAGVTHLDNEMEVDHIKKRFAAAFMRFSVNYYADLWEI